MSSHPLPIPTKRVRFNLNSFRYVAPRLLALLKPEIKLLSIGLLALLGGSALNLLFPYLIREFLNRGSIIEVSPTELGGITLLLITVFIFQGCCFFARHFYLQLVGLRIVRQLKNELMGSLLKQEISFFDESRLGDLLSRLGTDTEVVQRGLSVNVSVVIRYTIQVIGGLILMLYLSASLSLIIILLIPLLVIFSLFWSKKLRVLSKRVQDLIGESSICAEEALSGIRIVKVFGTEAQETNRFCLATGEVLDVAKNRTRIAAIFSSSMVTLLHISIAIVFWFGITSVINQQLSSGDLTAFLLYCTIVAVSFGFLTNAWAEFVQSIGAAERIYEIIDRTPKIQSAPDALSLPSGNPLQISFNNVSFRYPSRPEYPALNSVSFDIHAGQTIALVGPSGGGKSTIASLIPRLYDPSEGEISINGIPLGKICIQDLRNKISFVPQTAHLFSSSLKDNLRYSKPSASDEELEVVIKQAALTKLVERLSDGLNTLIGDKGIQLSGGERQRVSIARALLRNPEILILDEATSALDSQNENIIQEALKPLLKGRTTLIIAHRLSTIRHADMVLVLKEGEIIERGTHDELMDKKGLYHSMVQFQILK